MPSAFFPNKNIMCASQFGFKEGAYAILTKANASRSSSVCVLRPS